MTLNKIFSILFIFLGTTFLYSKKCIREIEHCIQEDEYCAPEEKCSMPKEECSALEEEDLFNKDCSAVFINGEFLYWTVSEGALDYALVTKSSSGESALSSARGDFKKAKFDWDPGFRVALGYYHREKLMNVWGEYTRLRVKNSNSATKPDDPDLYLNGTFYQVLNVLESARSHIRMNYDLVDFLVARVFIPNPHLRLRLLGGLTSAILKQRWNVKYYDEESFMTETKNKWKFFGGGVKIGLGIDWFWTHDFYLTGKSTFALLIGKYKNYAIQRTTLDPSDFDINVPFRDSKYDHYRPTFTAQFIIGPSWQKTFSCSRIEIFAGYEFNGWFNLHEIYRSEVGGLASAKETYINRELLALHGLTVRMTVDF
jgi:hypothetical protein